MCWRITVKSVQEKADSWTQWKEKMSMLVNGTAAAVVVLMGACLRAGAEAGQGVDQVRKQAPDMFLGVLHVRVAHSHHTVREAEVSHPTVPMGMIVIAQGVVAFLRTEWRRHRTRKVERRTCIRR